MGKDRKDKNDGGYEYPKPDGNRIIKSVVLSPWSVCCVVGALRREAKRYRDAGGTALQLAVDEEALANLFAAIDCDAGITVSPVPGT